MKLVKLLANLGYGSRKDVTAAVAQRLGHSRATAANWAPTTSAAHDDIRVDDEPLDPAQGMVLMLHKPVGYTCSTKDTGRLIYDLLPPRFRLRNPVLSSVGRLDRDTSGLLLMTDDGALLHRITSPKAASAEGLRGGAGQRPARRRGGDLRQRRPCCWNRRTQPLAPAGLTCWSRAWREITMIEGRYHQVRRMFAAVGNHVESLHRVSIGGLGLGDLEPGAWRLLDAGGPGRACSARVRA